MAESSDTLFPWIIITVGCMAIVAAVSALLYFIQKAKASRAEVEDEFEDDDDGPTAPIVPTVEMSRSPHDRHRDLTAGKSVVDQIERLEIIIASSKHQSKDHIVGQLEIFRESFDRLLDSCYFEEFSFEPGTLVDLEIRKKIIVSEGDSSGEQTEIAETLRCGFIYQYKDDEPEVVRKAEVAIR